MGRDLKARVKMLIWLTDIFLATSITLMLWNGLFYQVCGYVYTMKELIPIIILVVTVTRVTKKISDWMYSDNEERSNVL